MQPASAYFFRASDGRIGARPGARYGDRIRVCEDDEGCVVYGPYVTLPKGLYRAIIALTDRTRPSGELTIDVCARLGEQVFARSVVDLSRADPDDLRIHCDFTLEQETSRCEVRLHCLRGVSAEVASIEIAPLDHGQGRAEGSAASVIRANLDAQIFDRLDHLERLSRGGRAVYLGNNRILATVAAGERVLGFFLHADDKLLMPHFVMHGNYEPELTTYFTSVIRDTDHCLDVGANFGYFTCLMARMAPNGKTIGIEPDPDVFELLRDNIFANCIERFASPVQAAISDAEGRLTLHRRTTRSGNTSIAQVPAEVLQTLGEPPSQSFEVACRPLDSLLPLFDGRIDVIKVDVEGAEPLVFRGAREALQRNPGVKIVMEWSPGQIRLAGFDLGEFLNDLEALGLEAAVLGAWGPEPLELKSLLDGHPYHAGVLLTLRR